MSAADATVTESPSGVVTAASVPQEVTTCSQPIVLTAAPNGQGPPPVDSSQSVSTASATTVWSGTSSVFSRTR